MATLANQKPTKQRWRANKKQFSCLHINTENTVSEYHHPGKSFPKSPFPVTWEVTYMCTEGQNVLILACITHNATSGKRAKVTPLPMDHHGTSSHKKSCIEPFCFIVCHILNQVSSEFSCLAECCNVVFLQRSRNVLWTTQFHLTFHQQLSCLHEL